MTIWLGINPPVLASQSRARQALLTAAGLNPEIDPADIDERAVQKAAGITEPGEIAALLAREKALAVSRRRPDRFVIGADQTLALGTRAFNKPSGLMQAAEQLAALAGQTHELHSAVAVTQNGEVRFSTVSTARMTMRPLSGSEIEAYLREAGPLVISSVGAYQLEGLGVHLFDRIEGDHFTILGLPLLPLLAFLRRHALLSV